MHATSAVATMKLTFQQWQAGQRDQTNSRDMSNWYKAHEIIKLRWSAAHNQQQAYTQRWK